MIPSDHLKKALNFILSAKVLEFDGSDCLSFPKHIGKLGFKKEAAGKVRVFAMVEC